MRLQLLSDLHLENEPDFHAAAAPGADVLVLAGDVGSYQGDSELTARGVDDFGLGRFAPGQRGGWRHVVYVPGNHEYDALPHAATRERLRMLCARLGITLLDQGVAVIEGVRFVGCTLWADFDALATPEALALKAEGHAGGTLTGTPTRKTLARERRAAQAAAADPASELTRQLRERDKALRAANFYLRKNTTLRDADGTPMLAEDLRELGLREQAWLREALATPFDGPTVVITHFAPSLRSADPRYGLTPGTAGFCNTLDALVATQRLWLHGHLHCPHDYRLGDCRVVANPRGYAGKGEQAGFDPACLIEV